MVLLCAFVFVVQDRKPVKNQRVAYQMHYTQSKGFFLPKNQIKHRAGSRRRLF